LFQDQIKLWNQNLYYISSIITWKKKVLCLIKYINGSYSYSSLAYGSYVGQILSTTNLPQKFWYSFKPGNVVLLKFLKKYSLFFNFNINNKILYARASGTFCQVIDIMENLNLCKILLPSGIIKVVSLYSFVTLGRCSNIFNSSVVYGKAGYLNFKGKKPKNRGVARNPVDHPHGGNTKSNSPEVSPWGWVAKRNK
jgi:large subunit ribosomal protein L2